MYLLCKASLFLFLPWDFSPETQKNILKVLRNYVYLQKFQEFTELLQHNVSRFF